MLPLEIGYLPLTVVVGYVLATTSLHVLRQPEMYSRTLQFFLFPISMCSEERDKSGPRKIFSFDITLLRIAGVKLRNIGSHKRAAKRARILYILLTMLFWPIRLAWLVLCSLCILVLLAIISISGSIYVG